MAFFLSGKDLNHHKAKVAREDVCLPWTKCGLGLKKSSEWNKAAMSKHLWDLINLDPLSIWTKWVEKVKLKEKCI